MWIIWVHAQKVQTHLWPCGRALPEMAHQDTPSWAWKFTSSTKALRYLASNPTCPRPLTAEEKMVLLTVHNGNVNLAEGMPERIDLDFAIKRIPWRPFYPTGSSATFCLDHRRGARLEVFLCFHDDRTLCTIVHLLLRSLPLLLGPPPILPSCWWVWAWAWTLGMFMYCVGVETGQVRTAQRIRTNPCKSARIPCRIRANPCESVRIRTNYGIRVNPLIVSKFY